MKNNRVYIIVFIAMILMALYISVRDSFHKEDVISCTKETKTCPDGTIITRSGPLCEFQACPMSETMTKFFDVPTQEVIDWQQGIEYKYPKKLATDYITTSDWPPKISELAGSFSCQSGGSTLSSDGVKNEKIIEGNVYCVGTQSEGAAGSIYTTYNYTTSVNSKLFSVEFVLRSVQCDNYDDPQKTECKNEQKNFPIDYLAKNILDTIKPIEVDNVGRRCYVYNQVATKDDPYDVKENINIKINNQDVLGTKSGNQSGPDMTNGYEGTLKGSLNNDVMMVIYDYVIEGSQGKEQEEYKVVGDSLIKQRYPLVMENNILVPDKKGDLKLLEYKPEVCLINN